MKLIYIRLGSGIDYVETNQDPIITDFDCQLNYFCSLLTGKHCVANSLLYIVYQHHKLISSAGDIVQIFHKGDSLYSLLSKCFFLNQLLTPDLNVAFYMRRIKH